MPFDPVALTDVPRRHPVRAMHDAWMRMRGAARAPAWHGFDPVDHPTLLTWILLARGRLDLPDYGFSWVLNGEGVCDLLGFRPKDVVFGSLMPAADYRTRIDSVRSVLDGGPPFVARLRVPVEGREHVTAYEGEFPFLGESAAVCLICLIAPDDATV